MIELAVGSHPDGSGGSPVGSQAGSEALVDGLCRALADAAGRGILLASGPLSRRKTDWLLTALADELRQAERLVETLKQMNSRKE